MKLIRDKETGRPRFATTAAQFFHEPHGFPLTKAMAEWFKILYKAGRNDAMEEAAQRMEELSNKAMAAEIRALKK